MAFVFRSIVPKARKIFALSLLAGLVGARLSAGTVQFQVMPLAPASPPGSFRINYFLSGFDFLANQALELQFDAGLFASLSNGVASQTFDLLLFQPNNPPQAAGVYSALATVDHPVPSVFSVDAIYTGPGTPGSQVYFVDQFDSQGNFQSRVLSGITVPASTAVPEPATAFFAAMALFVGCAVRASRKRQTQQHLL